MKLVGDIMKKVYLEPIGCCRRRLLDASKLIRYFRKNNCSIVKDPSEADHIILVTCAFQKSREDSCFEAINKYSAYEGNLIVTGCLPGIAPSRLKDEFKGQFLVTKDLDSIDKFFPDFKCQFSTLSDSHEEFKVSMFKRILSHLEFTRPFHLRFINFLKGALSFRQLGRKSALLRVCSGCLGNCSYCAIRFSTGKINSKPISICNREYNGLLEKGYNHFVICGEDIGAYGIDIGSSLPKLFENLCSIDQSFKVSWEIPELHPRWAIKYKDELVKNIKSGKIVKLGCPIQSGSNKILKLMNRFYDTDNMINSLIELRNSNPELYLYTHMIIGFPSESDQDFQDTLDLIKKIRFDHVLLFTYSERKGTDAVQFDGKLSNQIKKERLSKALNFFRKEKILAICHNA